MDVVINNRMVLGVSDPNAENGVRWGQRICCGDPLKGGAKPGRRAYSVLPPIVGVWGCTGPYHWCKL